MLLKNRVFWSDNGVLKDISNNLNNHISGTEVIPFVADEDAFYFGSEAPFNHRWFETSVVNDQASIPSVSIWEGNSWIPCVECIDLTANSAGTTTLTKSDRIIWVPDKQKASWSRDDTNDGSGNVITGLSGVTIYNLFWAKMTFSGDFKATTAIAYIGHKFCNDEDLYNLYPEFNTNEAKARFKSGLTTFDQIHFEAAKEVIRDLKDIQVISSGNQILEWEVLRIPAIHKSAEMIFNAWGNDWKEEQDRARQYYKQTRRLDIFNVDLNSNGMLELKEIQYRSGRLSR